MGCTGLFDAELNNFNSYKRCESDVSGGDDRIKGW